MYSFNCFVLLCVYFLYNVEGDHISRRFCGFYSHYCAHARKVFSRLACPVADHVKGGQLFYIAAQTPLIENIFYIIIYYDNRIIFFYKIDQNLFVFEIIINVNRIDFYHLR